MKHVPERTCCACGAKRAPREMQRAASQNGSEPVLDESGKAPGRGAYLCKSGACVEKALARKALERALKLTNPPREAFVEQLRAANRPVE